MRKVLPQRRSRTHAVAAPLWLRVLAGFALLLLAGSSTVQVCHTHAEDATALRSARPAATSTLDQSDLPSHEPGQTPASPADHCPLCIAMHSASPASMHVIPEPLVAFAALQPVRSDAQRALQWPFDLLSRPPPASTAALA